MTSKRIDINDSSSDYGPAIMHDFRWNLKNETQHLHDELDKRIGTLDLACRSDLARFFQMQLSGFESFLSPSEQHDLLIALRSDIKRLRATEEVDTVGRPQSAHPLAAAYIVDGSRMGARVLKKRWQGTVDPDVRSANAYFGLTDQPSTWPETCQKLTQIDPTSDVAQTIISDTTRLFGAFLHAFDCTATVKSVQCVTRLDA